jgi:hypothetical protein
LTILPAIFFNASFFVPAGFEANSGTTESLVLKCGFKLHFYDENKIPHESRRPDEKNPTY